MCPAMLMAACSILQKPEIVRIQKQRSAANKYAAGNWMDRRDAVRDIIKYLGKDKNDLIVGTLVVASQDNSPAVRIEAVQGLARVKSEKTASVVKKLAADEKEHNVRWYALKALRFINDPSSWEIYVKGLVSEDWLIREESIRGILAINDAVVAEKMAPYIIRAINDPRTSVAITALQNLERKDSRLYPAIVKKFESCNEYSYSLLGASLTALDGYRLDPKTKEKVINLLVHDSADIRILALRVLKKDQVLTGRVKK
jgi:hypothetical protein